MRNHFQWVCLVGGVVCPAWSLAASFECANAAAPIEKLICAHDATSNLDSELGATFSYVRGITYGQANTALVADQKEWLAGVRDKCSQEHCLREAYTARIEALTRIKTSKTSAQYVTSKEDRLAQMADFQRSLRDVGISGELTACDLMIEVIDDRGGRDRSLGAICKLDGRTIMVCDDTMIGKLTLKLYGFAVTAKDVSDFTADNCPSGG